MRSIYFTLQKLKDQEKKERHRRFAEAQNLLITKEQELVAAKTKLLQERGSFDETIGMQIVNEHLNMQRHMHIEQTEKDIVKQTEVVERLRDEMKEAQIECKVMEKVISSIQEEERKEYERKLDIINDEIAVLGWRRKQ